MMIYICTFLQLAQPLFLCEEQTLTHSPTLRDLTVHIPNLYFCQEKEKGRKVVLFLFLFIYFCADKLLSLIKAIVLPAFWLWPVVYVSVSMN